MPGSISRSHLYRERHLVATSAPSVGNTRHVPTCEIWFRPEVWSFEGPYLGPQGSGNNVKAIFGISRVGLVILYYNDIIL